MSLAMSNLQISLVPPTKTSVLGIGVSRTNHKDCAKFIVKSAQRRQSCTVAPTPVHGIMTGYLNSEGHGYRLNNFTIVTPDGQPVRWAVNLLRRGDEKPLTSRVDGPTVMLDVCEQAAAEKISIFLYGSTTSVLENLQANLKKKFPDLKIAGAISPPFRPLTEEEDARYIQQIRESGAGIVFIGLGCPRQEAWAFEHRHQLDCPLVCAGAAFDFHAGNLAKAPLWMQNTGLEWFFRLSQEPRRLWRRYVLLNPLYLTLLFLQFLGLLPNTSLNQESNKDIAIGRRDLRAPTALRLRRGLVFGLLRATAFVLLDSLMIVLAWRIANLLGAPTKTFYHLGGIDQSLGLLLPVLMISVSIIAAAGLYGTCSNRRDGPGLIQSLTLAQVIFLSITLLDQPDFIISRSAFLGPWLLTLFFVCAGRFLAEKAIFNVRRQGMVRREIFLIGRLEDTQQVLELLDRKEYEVLGLADLPSRDDRKHWAETLERINRLRVGEVFVCSWQFVSDPMLLYWSLKTAGLQLRIVPVGLELPDQMSKVEMLGKLSTIQFLPPSIVGSDFWAKRCFDVVIGALTLILASPLFLLIAALIKLDSPGPIFTRQTRVGLRGQHFDMWKFRTMAVDTNRSPLKPSIEADTNESNLPNKDILQLTQVGRFLCRYSLDDLPQILNVLQGNMSFVGPRPYALQDAERFFEQDSIRHEVLPGITGLWQVSSRPSTDNLEDLIRLDLGYIRDWSLFLDFQILLQTFKVVLRKAWTC